MVLRGFALPALSCRLRLERDRLKVKLCEASGVRLIVVPFYVTDLWSFLRLHLLRWFAIREIFPIMLPTS